MYCGCNEIAQSSQARIARALLALMERKPFSAVTVSELCRAAGVSRPTFYSLFGSMEDVVRYLLASGYCDSPRLETEGLPPLEALCLGYSRYIADHRDFLALLMRSGLFQVLYRSIEESLADCPCFLPEADPALRRCAVHFTAGGLAGFIQSYTEGEALPAEAVRLLLEKLLSGAPFA